jgi:hypothetical protein
MSMFNKQMLKEHLHSAEFILLPEQEQSPALFAAQGVA